MHAALMYAAQYGTDVAYGSVIFLSVAGEKQLAFLAEKLGWHGIKTVCFREPDLGLALTAIAAGPEAAKKLSHLHLALRGGEIDG